MIERMDIIDKARRIERHIARGVTGMAQTLRRGESSRDPIELVHAIVEAVEREIQPGGRGRRVFPFNTIEVSFVAASDHARARLETVVNADVPLAERIANRLISEGCTVHDLAVTVGFVPRAQKHWTDPQFGVAFSRVAREAPSAPAAAPVVPRLELAVVNGVADRRAYAFAAERIDVGRGSDVRDGRNTLIRTNQVAFAEQSGDVNGSVSRQHAHIAYDGRSGAYRVHDDGSVYGTKIVRKGRTVPVPFGSRGVRLQPGDEIVLGEARLRVRFGA
jgi:hypothetical protein